MLCSKSIYIGINADVTDAGRDGTSEDSATQLLICEPLSFAISITRPNQSVSYFWQLLATFDTFWQLLATFHTFWLLLATFGNFWQLLATSGNF